MARPQLKERMAPEDELADLRAQLDVLKAEHREIERSQLPLEHALVKFDKFVVECHEIVEKRLERFTTSSRHKSTNFFDLFSDLDPDEREKFRFAWTTLADTAGHRKVFENALRSNYPTTTRTDEEMARDLAQNEARQQPLLVAEENLVVRYGFERRPDADVAIVLDCDLTRTTYDKAKWQSIHDDYDSVVDRV